MNKTFSLTCLVAIIVASVSCTKMDQDLDMTAAAAGIAVQRSGFQATEFLSSSVGVIPREQQTIFSAGADGSIAAYLLREEGLATVRLIRIESEGQVAFTSAAKPSDTVLVAYFNSEGRVASVKQGDAADFNFLPANFYYKNGRLSNYDMDQDAVLTKAEFSYDQRGNIVRISEKTGEESLAVTEYSYDPYNRAAAQVYQEVSGTFNNSFALLQYAGYFPELNPSSLRTRTRVVWDGDYEVYNLRLANHKKDLNGLLTSYDIVDEDNNVLRTHLVSWKERVAE